MCSLATRALNVATYFIVSSMRAPRTPLTYFHASYMQSIYHLRMTNLCKCNNNTTWKKRWNNIELRRNSQRYTNLLIPFCLNTHECDTIFHIYVYVQLKWHIPIRKFHVGLFLSLSTWFRVWYFVHFPLRIRYIYVFIELNNITRNVLCT